MTNNKKLYYAHSMRKYKSREEKNELTFLHKRFVGYKIVNPAKVNSQNMADYFDIVDTCDVLVFSEFAGSLGKGVFAECEYAMSQGKLAYLLRDNVLYEKFKIVLLQEDWAINWARVVDVGQVVRHVPYTKPEQGAK